MKRLCILYLYLEEEKSFITKVLSSHYSVHTFDVRKCEEIEERIWDMVVLQDAVYGIWQEKIFCQLKKYPWLFISTRQDVHGYIALCENLFGVINLGGGDLSVFGIPEEIQLWMNRPVEEIADYYLCGRPHDICHIVYCPTGSSINENDFKLFGFIQKTHAILTIVSDEYQMLSGAFPTSINIIPRMSWQSAFKNAHLVVAYGYNALCAMALCKPCVVLGNRGLGGMVTPANYEQLQSVFFMGRKGGYIGEMVPSDLLEVEIRKAFSVDCKDAIQIVQQKVIKKYDKGCFSEVLIEKVEQIVTLFGTMKDQKKRLFLKPFLSSAFRVEEINCKQYMMRGMLCFGEMDEGMSELLKQCDGETSIQALIEQNGYGSQDTIVLWENLYGLWKEKLILFNL